MELSDSLTAVSSKTTRKLGTALAVGTFAMCLLLGVGTAQAQTVERDGDTVTAIRGLELGNFVYDVEFPNRLGSTTYDAIPAFGATFDFDTQEEALAAVDAVNSILTAEGVSKVGVSASEASNVFNVGFREEEFRFHRIDYQIVFVLYGSNSGPVPGQWVADFNVYALYASIVTWADFTIVDFTGFDLPPFADANGPYTGVVGGAVAFDGTTSKDLDGTIVTYDWDFGDRTNSIGSTPSQTYAEAGIYNVTLTVTDDSGATDSDSTIAIIQPNEPGQCEWAIPGRPKWCRQLQGSLAATGQ